MRTDLNDAHTAVSRVYVKKELLQRRPTKWRRYYITPVCRIKNRTEPFFKPEERSVIYYSSFAAIYLPGPLLSRYDEGERVLRRAPDRGGLRPGAHETREAGRLVLGPGLTGPERVGRRARGARHVRLRPPHAGVVEEPAPVQVESATRTSPVDGEVFSTHVGARDGPTLAERPTADFPFSI